MLNSAHRDDWPVLSHDAGFIHWIDDVADTHTHIHTPVGGGEILNLKHYHNSKKYDSQRTTGASFTVLFTFSHTHIHKYFTRLNKPLTMVW